MIQGLRQQAPVLARNVKTKTGICGDQPGALPSHGITGHLLHQRETALATRLERKLFEAGFKAIVVMQRTRSLLSVKYSWPFCTQQVLS